jgi:pyrroline-5-carboxylate reductase
MRGIVVKGIVFIGGGRITSAMIAGLRLANFNQPVVVHDRNPKKLQRLKRQYGVVVAADLRHAVRSARLLMIAVRPDSVAGLLEEIQSYDIPKQLFTVSLAAGIPLSKLRKGLGTPVRWARAMPSPVCRGGRGLTALTFSREFPSTARAEVRKLFALVGQVLEIPEKRFDAFTVTFSSSHGYHALATLIAAAKAVGLDGKVARVAAAHALADGIAAWRDGGVPLDELLQEAATPGGTAAAVMAAMDVAGYREMVERGLRAGVRRARRNARHLSFPAVCQDCASSIRGV